MVSKQNMLEIKFPQFYSLNHNIPNVTKRSYCRCSKNLKACVQKSLKPACKNLRHIDYRTSNTPKILIKQTRGKYILCSIYSLNFTAFNSWDPYEYRFSSGSIHFDGAYHIP